MIKVIFFHHFSLIGGAGLSGINALQSLDRSKYDITVYCPSNNSYGIADKCEELGYSVIRTKNSPRVFLHFSGGEVSVFSIFFWINLAQIIIDKRQINKILKTMRPDIVVMNSMTTFWIAKLAKRYNAQTILFFRETYTHGLFGIRNRIIKKNFERYVDKIAFISNYEMDRTNINHTLKQTIYNAEDGEKYDNMNKSDCRLKLGLEKDKFYILYVGGMSELKGADVILKALSKICDKRIELIFVGYEWSGNRIGVSSKKGILRKLKLWLGYNYEANCIDFLLKHKLSNRVRFFGSTDNITPFFKACDVLVVPMTKPHQARPVFEAGFAGLPVVITNFPQIYELIDQTSGYLFENRNAEELAGIIVSIMNNNALAQEKVVNNLKNTRSRHGIRDYRQNVRNLFELSVCK